MAAIASGTPPPPRMVLRALANMLQHFWRLLTHMYANPFVCLMCALLFAVQCLFAVFRR